ncbi:DUF1653 domain-containing protein [Mobilitalea sibirica]|uniref:DUF1653 domain-containing protein n=1 Tax=Mobilitalea sibirica TaxID=1462919 RepID=A0A8J7KRW4_9FIRM|nr:DUF1653 domain-containing protein [Mobilitalea sibirica]MBH1939696.1 DUF1653 domain-containing protein [Mobilitalea sibirica]
MKQDKLPKQGDIFKLDVDKPCQIVTNALHSQTGENMVVYQELYGDFLTYVEPLALFLSKKNNASKDELCADNNHNETDNNLTVQSNSSIKSSDNKSNENNSNESNTDNTIENVDNIKSVQEGVNTLLMDFLEAPSYNKKLEIITSNRKHMSNRLINDMAVSLDCTVEDGPLENRIKELIYCLQAMARFEDRRLR